MSRILIAEDDTGIAEFIARGLESAGYCCDVVDSGPVAFGMARSGAYQLMILDLGLPDMDGTDILEQLRALGATLPIIVLTARTGLEDRIRTLEGGANDYMPKPFQFAELLARVRLRLSDTSTETAQSTTQLEHSGMVLDLRAHRVLVADKWRDLSRRELGLLETLMRHPGQILSRAQLLSQVWGMDFDPGSNVVDVYIRSLRKKIGQDKVETVRGSGYRLR
ncbi:MAG: response regulator transcription factor [Corynebacterium sp.]|uniref:response regulator transcription factor n=1 Tax=Corynebacterium sp. TaxID=1720 RepID=UPI0026DBF7A2|nr:response regulator transcription factor [Corynebacterium sp.]MDO5098915.1 response regulator transcription factor [Corynebacterium sp.]